MTTKGLFIGKICAFAATSALGCGVPPPRPAHDLPDPGGAQGGSAPLEPPLADREAGADAGCTGPDCDRDGVIDPCDQCPDRAEVYNGIDDHDGCPDTSGTIHARITYPPNRFGGPLVEIAFNARSAKIDQALRHNLGQPAIWDEGIEEILCLGQAAPGERGGDALSLARAEALCNALSIPAPVARSSAGAGAKALYTVAPPGVSDVPRPRAIAQVLRARGVVVYRWSGQALERGEAPLEAPPPAPGCDWNGKPIPAAPPAAPAKRPPS